MTTVPNPADAPALEIRITLTSGDICRFAVDDPTVVQKTLKDIQPSRLFSTPQLLLGGDVSLSVFPSTRIERVDLIGGVLPVWPFLGGATDVREVSEAEFRATYDPNRYAADRRLAGLLPGSPQVGYTAYKTVSGLHLFWEVHMESRSLMPMDFRPYLQALLGAGGLHAHTSDGGVVVLNPANLNRITFHPAPPALPSGTWPVRRL